MDEQNLCFTDTQNDKGKRQYFFSFDGLCMSCHLMTFSVEVLMVQLYFPYGSIFSYYFNTMTFQNFRSRKMSRHFEYICKLYICNMLKLIHSRFP